jgi:tetratricopeptide (TPR) repeat protein
MNQPFIPSSHGSARWRPLSRERRDEDASGCLRDLAVAYQTAGNAFLAHGLLPAALDKYQAALGIFQRLAIKYPHDRGLQIDLALAFTQISEAQAAAGRDKAREAMDRANDLGRTCQLHPTDAEDRETLAPKMQSG